MSTPDKTAADLEWSALMDELASRTTSDAGAERARDLAPEAELSAARARVRRTAEAMSLASQGQFIPVNGVVDTGDLLTRLARDAVATAPELHALRNMLRAAHALRRFATAHRDTHPALSAALTSDPTLDRLLETLDHAIDPDGGLSDRASADLAHARRRAGEMRQRVIGRLEELISRYAEVLQDRYYTVRDGRYVLPVRSDSHIKVPGIVLGSSASGATLFIEPRAVMSLGNQLKVATADVEREEARLLAELSDRARHHVDSAERAYEALLDGDVLLAIVRLGDAMHAIALEPEADSVLDLREVRHPLLALAGIDVVPNDLAIGSGHVLVISGPNAGGKTVALKCLGLCALMVRAGLPLPVAEGSRIGWFDPVLSDVGDDQSITRSLSTFSAHVTNLSSIIARAGSASLVLLDELAGGTDPEEGAVLAAAVLERLAQGGAAVAVTTHYELLKTLAVRDERFVNASVGFDLRTMSPTFRVTLGIPGASSALAVAERYGIPHEVIARAQTLLPEQSVSREDVLRRIQDEQIAAQIARHAAEQDQLVAARLRTEIESERNLQRAREQQKISREGDELLGAIRRARDELRGAEARLNKRKSNEDDLRAASRAVDAVASQVALGGALATAVGRAAAGPARRPAREDELRPGARMYVARLGSTVEVIDRPAKGQVRVAAGPMKLFVPVAEAMVEEVPPVVDKRPVLRVASEPVEADINPPLRVESNTCDVRGLRADDALGMVDAFLDRAFGEGNTSGFVLHGHGTGALKLAVREHLKTSPYVVRARAADPEDGGDAFTVFWLKR